MTPRRPIRFRPDVTLNVAYEDRTNFGSPIGQGPERAVRSAFAPLLPSPDSPSSPDSPDSPDWPGAIDELRRSTPRTLDRLRRSDVFAAMTVPSPDGWRVRDEVLHPDPAANLPRLLTVARPDTDHVVRARMPLDYWAGAHELLARLDGGALDPAAFDRLPPDLGRMVALFENEQLLEEAPDGADGPELDGPGLHGQLTFFGHNTVLVRSATTSVVVDPLLFAPSAANPAGYQPLTLRQLGRPDAVVITHGHPDHFDPASLLRLPPTATVIVPAVERETLLSPDLAARAAQLGFVDVRALRWGESTTVGDITIRAHPFVGEQPTDSSWLHPEIRNQGCTYVVATPEVSAAFLADSGADHLGRVADVALEARRCHGPVDVVFCGYRGWQTYPAQLLASSVARYFLLVPPDLWGCRMTLMATADTALDVAERWGASVLVPYADGGAPWHWRLGLGPRLDDPAGELEAFDPFPERVADAARRRSDGLDGTPLPSPVKVEVMRPGQSLRRLAGAAGESSGSDGSARFEVVDHDHHRWPFGTAGPVEPIPVGRR